MVLGLHLGSALGGFAAEGSKFMDDERKRANKLIDDAMSKWETKGSANWDSHVANKKATRKLARALKPYLSVDQIGVALEQGRGEEVLAQIKKYNNMSPETQANVGYSLQNVVNMGENYESSGMTMDEMINSVVGKVSGGMTLSDAFADTGQSKGITFDKLFNPNMNKLAKKRIEAIESISGKGSVANLRQYATGTVTSTDLPFTGTINLASGLEEAAVKKTMRELSDDKGTITRNSAMSETFKLAADLIEGAEFTTSINERGERATNFNIPTEITEANENASTIKIRELFSKRFVELQDRDGKISGENLRKIHKEVSTLLKPTKPPKGNENRDTAVIQIDMANAIKVLVDGGANVNGKAWRDNYAKLLKELEKSEGKTLSDDKSYLDMALAEFNKNLTIGRVKKSVNTTGAIHEGYTVGDY
tara:strand:- start:626 stop:1891 length:1266 start_codon:yes stop_codon:yes gene_type:complete